MAKRRDRAAGWLLALLGIFVLFAIFLFLPRAISPTAARPIAPQDHNGAAIAVTGDGQLVLVINPDSNSLSLLATGSLDVVAEVPVGLAPQNVALANGEAIAFVTNKGSSSVSVVDLASRRTTDNLPTGDRPVGLAVSPDGRFLAVAEMGADTIRFFDVASLQTIGQMPVSDRPYGLAFTPDGHYLLVSHLLSGEVTVLPVRPYLSYVPVIGLGGTLTTKTEMAAPSAAPAGTVALTIPTWPQVAPAPAVVVSSDGHRAYLPQTMANGLGLNTQFDNSVFPKVSVLDLDALVHATGEHVSLPETDQPVGLPWAVALARDDSELWVVNAASNNLSVIDISQPTLPLRQAHLEVGANPRGIALSPDGLTAYVNNTLDGTVSVIDTHSYTTTAVVPVTSIPLPPLLLAGKRLYFSSAQTELARASWISCNTCHIEGEHDGRTWLLQYIDWDMAAGPPAPPAFSPIGATPTITRNTTSLLGMIETYPLRWSAEWNESADSEFSIRFEQFGAGLVDSEMHPPLGQPNQGRSLELDALAAFIDSLSLPPRSHTLTAAEARGRLLFAAPQTECLSCHPPPLYTDLQQHDVGTADATGELLGPAIDTPSLRFLYDSAPYLHDGSAATLLDVLTTANPAGEHGRTDHLSTAELNDLVAFLRALPYGD